MVNVMFSPTWFWGVDALFEAVAIITTAMLSFYAYKLYRFTSNIRHKYFSLSFLMISIGFAAKVVTNLLLYFPGFRQRTIAFFLLKYYILSDTNFFYAVGNFVFRFFMLLGLVGIFWIIGKSRERNKLIFLLYFASLTALVSIFAVKTSYFMLDLYGIFHFTAALFLGYISYFYYKNYSEKKKKNNVTFCIFLSFLLIAISQLVFIFVLIDLRTYVLAEFLQLAGYFLLLFQHYLLARGK